jgi:hypothetical protein
MPARRLRAARNLDLFRHPAIRVLLDLRALPQRIASRLSGRRDGGDHIPATFLVEDMTRYGWELLGENPREIVLGQISRPWKAAGATAGPSRRPRSRPMTSPATPRSLSACGSILAGPHRRSSRWKPGSP